ncbi:ANTAR domain-containing protein, partial [Priestia megaterium]|uniref:ANTAR domain-containing response regulator n=2 Tax=Bacillaceae TaxID=186817 RepID=UPI002FFFDEBC
PILLLTAYSQKEFIDKAKKANIVGYLVKPISESNLIPAVEIALQQAENAKMYEQRVQEMNNELKKRKIVEKAKGILMDKYNLTEDRAFKKMRTISMKKQVTLEKLAKHIIEKYGT